MCAFRSMLRTFFWSVRLHERSQTRRAADIDLALLLPIIGEASYVQQTNTEELSEGCQEADQSSHIATRCWRANDRVVWGEYRT